ncbi:NfeD family protein [uncultured Pseudodesulfovibrio sp.]|uniref:NfeD family protein n=1 Tax=uncultured Pseudodesulfovibrio sp. TaxID=2035858 RepID=UPI0029C8F0E1|nr:NfeD family protein [uncultured Pseudodesulfovibrio sp.]
MESFVSAQNIQWLIWLGIGLVFVIAELAVPAFIVVFFGAGAFIAGATAFFGASVPVQLVVFGVSSVILLLLFRKMMAATFTGEKAEDEQERNVIGQLAEVVDAIRPPQPGRIKFQGSFWSARSSEPVEPDSMVRIVKRDENDVNTFVVEKEQ